LHIEVIFARLLMRAMAGEDDESFSVQAFTGQANLIRLAFANAVKLEPVILSEDQ